MNIIITKDSWTSFENCFLGTAKSDKNEKMFFYAPVWTFKKPLTHLISAVELVFRKVKAFDFGKNGFIHRCFLKLYYK